MKSLTGTFFGIVLVIAAAVLLFWNEGRAVATARALAEGAGLVREIDANAVDPTHEGLLVHISGAAKPQGAVRDPLFGVAAQGIVRLARDVEMYQWKEVAREVERTGNDGKTVKSTVYDYRKQWSPTAIDSSRFKAASAPQNPPMPAAGENFDVDRVAVGAFFLSGREVAHLGRLSPVALTDGDTTAAATALGSGRALWLVDNRFHFGNDTAAPEIGDVRVSYQKGTVDTISAVGAQSGNRIAAYTASNGKDILLVETGTMGAGEMFKDAVAGNTVLTWVLRIVGAVMAFVGSYMSLSILTGLGDAIPGLGGVARAGAGVVSFAMTVMVCAVVIALGWLFFRPVLSIAILLAAVAIVAALGKFGGRGRQQAA